MKRARLALARLLVMAAAGCVALPGCGAAGMAAGKSAPAPGQHASRHGDNATPRARAGEEVFYHVFFRSFRDSNGDRIGDLRGMIEGLDYLQGLGITSILLTPLQPSPFYHNYFATDFESIEPAYGTMDDYRAFLRAAHARGLKVYLDMEIQYVGQGHRWWTQSIGQPGAPYAGYLLWRDAQQRQAEPFLGQREWEGYDGRWHGIAMVDMDSPEVRAYFQRVLLRWADPHGDGSGRDAPDGFRIDHMMDDLDHKGLATDLFATFWTPIFDALRARRPGFRIIAEQADWGYGTDWLLRGKADLVFAFPLRGAMVRLDKARIVEALRETARRTPAGKGQIVFLENHDTDRAMSLLASDQARARAAAAIALLVQGEPLIHYGQEIGMRGITGKIGTSDGNHVPLREAMRWRASLDAAGSATWYRHAQPWWDDRYNRSGDGVSVEEQSRDPGSLLNWYRRLLALRRERAELRNGRQALPCPDAGPVLCVLRDGAGGRTLLLANLGTAPAPAALDAHAASAAWRTVIGQGDAQASLAPLEVRVLVDGAGR